VTSDSGDHNYKYDKVGNRTEQTIGNVTKAFEYSQVSNQLEAVRQDSLQGEVLEYFNYNQNGHTEYYSENELVYNGSDRLVEYKGVDPQKPFTWVLIDTGGVLAPIKAPLYQDVTSYRYNAQGQRVQKSNNSETYHYLYDEGGKLIAEQKKDGSALKEYIYLYGEVIGFVKGSELYFVHNDHLTRAEAITDKDQNTVWRANNYAFDRSVSVNQIGDYNLGFPGQYYDEETGLYYNYFRDYDPSTGRYIQSDPLGLAAGVNTYGYVKGNPIKYIDFWGLAAKICYRPLDAWGVNNVVIGAPGSMADRDNNIVGHQHIIFDNGDNIGFGPDGLFSENVEEKDYQKCQEGFDEDRMRNAIKKAGDPGEYDFFIEDNNCQDYIDKVLDNY
jgi:RHS repeat-associated protein